MTNPTDPRELLTALHAEYQRLHSAGQLAVKAKLRGIAHGVTLDSIDECQAASANCT